MSVARRHLRTGLIGLVGVAALVATACGTASSDPVSTERTPVTVGGVGQLPDPLSGQDDPGITDEVGEAVSTVPPIARTVAFAPLGEQASGNRLIVIGDSITASTARRYGGEMCFALLPLGWAVEVNAEVSRFVDFGHRVLDRRLRPAEGADWDAAVVFLGTNYGGDAERYGVELEGIVDRLAPRPTVLVTVTEFRPDRAQVNTVVRELALAHQQVEVLEWAELTRADRSLLAADGIHLSAEGRARLVIEVAELLGPAPDLPGPGLVGDDQRDEETDAADGSRRPDGECLPTSFTDDSAGRRPGAAPPPATLVGGGRPVSTSPGTAAPTTAAPGTNSSGTTSPPTSPGTSPGTTSPPSAGPGGGSPTTSPGTADEPPMTPPSDGSDDTAPTTIGPAPDTTAGEGSATTAPTQTTAAPTTAPAPATTSPATTAPATAAPDTSGSG